MLDVQVNVIPYQNTSLSPDFGPLTTVMAENTSDRSSFLTNETFHTPGFGEDDFDISSLNFPVVSNNISNSDSQHFSSQQQTISSHLLGSMNIVYGQNSPTTISCSAIDSMETDVAPKFPPQNFDVPDISITNSLNSTSDSVLYSVQSMYTMNGGHIDSMASSGGRTLSTINNSDISAQLGFRSSVKQGSPASSSNSTTSPSRESSEDSDDCLPLAQLAMLKRQTDAPPIVEEPVPEVTTTTTTTTKTKKTPKKKKKKDPNEPQKPVSAYALFFRDTQAAIKGQNPSATFGEVSKIVASMWDGLDPEHKSVYKKKTENAKKEYLKQLAAYRASLVSQAAIDDGSILTDKSLMTRPMKHLNIQPQGNMSPQMSDNMGMMGQMPMNTSPAHVTSPLHHQSPPDHNMGYNSPPQQYNQPNLVNIAPRPVMGNEMDGDLDCNMMPTMCVRMGCTNAAIESPGWDNEYCSNECVVSHCRDVFTAWVSTRQGNNSFQVK